MESFWIYLHNQGVQYIVYGASYIPTIESTFSCLIIGKKGQRPGNHVYILIMIYYKSKTTPINKKKYGGKDINIYETHI